MPCDEVGHRYGLRQLASSIKSAIEDDRNLVFVVGNGFDKIPIMSPRTHLRALAARQHVDRDPDPLNPRAWYDSLEDAVGALPAADQQTIGTLVDTWEADPEQLARRMWPVYDSFAAHFQLNRLSPFYAPIAVMASQGWITDYITTNYDGFMNSALERMGVPYRQNPVLPTGSPLLHPDYHCLEGVDSGHLRLLKVHGDIRYYYSRSSDELHKRDQPSGMDYPELPGGPWLHYVDWHMDRGETEARFEHELGAARESISACSEGDAVVVLGLRCSDSDTLTDALVDAVRRGVRVTHVLAPSNPLTTADPHAYPDCRLWGEICAEPRNSHWLHVHPHSPQALAGSLLLDTFPEDEYFVSFREQVRAELWQWGVTHVQV